MDGTKLDNCSPLIKSTLSHIDDFYVTFDDYNLNHAPTIFLLNRFGSSHVGGFFNKLDQDVSPSEIRHTVIEYPDHLTYLYKLYNSFDEEANPDSFSLVLETHKNQQQQSGRILNSHAQQLRSLVNACPEAKCTQKALNYFFDQEAGQDLTEGNPETCLNGAIALLELDYERYEGLVGECLRFWEDEIGDLEKNNLRDYNLPNAALLASAKHLDFRLDEDIRSECIRVLEDVCKELCKDISDDGLEEALAEKEYFSDDTIYYKRLAPAAKAIQALTAAGLGYSISGFSAEWRDELAAQRRQRTNARFVSTLPATRVSERKRDIYNKIEDMISSAEDILRISSLRIDILQNQIIDLSEREDPVEVRILTNEKSGKGDRRKMASAVMNELVRRTEGNVHADNLVHARLIIVDDRELLVSSADLTRDQLVDEFNGGIFTKDPVSVSEAIETFDKIWNESAPRDVN